MNAALSFPIDATEEYAAWLDSLPVTSDAEIDAMAREYEAEERATALYLEHLPD